VTPGADRHDAFPRRRFLQLSGALVATPLAARLARAVSGGATTAPRPRAGPPGAADPAGTTVTLTPAPATVDLGGPVVNTWAYADSVPGPAVRIRAGRPLVANVENHLPDPTTVHWHGISLPFDMDGVPGVTQAPIEPGATFTYRFSPTAPGTYFLHPHVGLQLDRGLFAPLIVDDPHDPGDYDDEWIVVLDDWTDGVGPSPDELLANLTGSSGGGDPHMPGMAVPARLPSPTGRPIRMLYSSSALLGGNAGHIAYPLYLVNGRVPESPSTFRTRPGARVRLRLINAGAETSFRVALAGHHLDVTHADGYAVAPVTVDAVLLGMAERIDALFTARDGVFPLFALAEGKRASGRALLRTATGSVPPVGARPKELDGRVLTVSALRPAPDARLHARRPDRTLRVELGGSHHPYRWTINGRTYGDDSPLIVDIGQRVRLEFVNRSPMYHPMHLHGHTFAVLDRDRRPGVRKDTVIVLPGETVRADFDADNSGDWMLHCHNAYHMEAGMMTSVYYSGA
jgi:multicopper oxidase